MDKVIGSVTIQQEQILHGDHHIIAPAAIVDETAAFGAGTLLVAGETGYSPLAKSDSTHAPVAVAIEALEKAADGSVIPACVHGAVRTEKLKYADGTKITFATAEKLRETGIYCIAGEGFEGYAEAEAAGGNEGGSGSGGGD